MHAFDGRTDGQTDRRTDRQTDRNLIEDRDCIPCSAVKTVISILPNFLMGPILKIQNANFPTLLVSKTPHNNCCQ